MIRGHGGEGIVTQRVVAIDGVVDNAAVTPRRVALTCVQHVVNFCHTSSHARHGRGAILICFANVVHV